MSNEKEKIDCPYCGEEILKVAVKCKHCKSDLDENLDIENNEAPDNDYLWGLILTPILVVIISLFIEENIYWIWFVLNSIFTLLDVRTLKKEGYNAPNSIWCFIVPVYLWKRIKCGKFFYMWVIIFVSSFFLESYINETNLEATATPLVTKMIQNNWGTRIKCKGVKITEKISDNVYKAKATLDNWKELNLIIEKKRDKILVRIIN